MKPCEILKHRSDVDECTSYLRKNGYSQHRLKCKNWDIAHVIGFCQGGNFLDMGSSDSFILQNIASRSDHGRLCGIDRRRPIRSYLNFDWFLGIEHLRGDMLRSGFPGNYFDNISCLSVIEHGVSLRNFAEETSRLLKPQGRLFVTFDYWPEKIRTDTRLYHLPWNILERRDVETLIALCGAYGLDLIEKMDWTVGEKVITPEYYAPPKSGMSYTFGILTFEKK